MITNEKQYKVTKAEIVKFKEALDSFDVDSASQVDIHPAIIEAQRQALEFKKNQLESLIQEYENLKAGHVVLTRVRDIKDLPIALIKARIANGLTQSELAEKLGLKEQQIQRYESSEYETANIKTLAKISNVLGLEIDGDIQLKHFDVPDEFNIKHYPFKQMFQRKWFTEVADDLNEAVKRSPELIYNLFEKAGLQNKTLAFNKRSIRIKGSFNEYALNAWYARVIIKAREQELNTFFDKRTLTQEWLYSLATLSIQDEGPKLALEQLNRIGIRVVIEQHLEGTHLDGASFLMDDIFPVIALTLRHDRLDNFWFVLFHEIAHVYLHLGADITTVFDDLDANMDGIEKEADQFALNAMIPDNIWKKALARFSPSEDTIVAQAKKIQVHTALVAGRIRKETGKYYQFTELVGLGEVRRLFANEINH